MVKSATRNFYARQILRVLVHIQRHLDEPLSLDELAGIACLSPYHFHHVFSGMLGESLASHVRRLRLERAAWRLKLGDQPVIAIAQQAGYRTHEAFTRAFRAAFDTAPREYRRRHRASIHVHAVSNVHFHPHASIRRFQPAFRVQSGGVEVNVIVRKLPACRVAFVRHVGPYSAVGSAWDRLLTLVGKDGWLGGDTQFLGICHDDPAVTPSHRIRYDACVTIDPRFEARDDIGVQVVPGGEYAVLTHIGAYSNLAESYRQLFGLWLPQSGRRLRMTPSFEAYLNSPESTAPEDLIVDLHVPLESR
jgi:AraC family transcriptional regulator